MKLLMVLTLVLSSHFAQANEWFIYDYVGECVTEESDGTQGVLQFYSEEMSPGQAVRGFITVSLQTGSKRAALGAWNATYKLAADESAMEVLVDAAMKIPFGKNVVVKDENGKEAVCTTERP